MFGIYRMYWHGISSLFESHFLWSFSIHYVFCLFYWTHAPVLIFLNSKSLPILYVGSLRLKLDRVRNVYEKNWFSLASNNYLYENVSESDMFIPLKHTYDLQSYVFRYNTLTTCYWFDMITIHVKWLWNTTVLLSEANSGVFFL